MRRILLLISIAAFMAATMVLPGTAFADPTNNNSACFDDYAQEVGPPGGLVSTAANTPPQEPGGNAHVAQVLNYLREDYCQALP
jgi:hypothetical protein